jgi:hypothetical protein
MCFRPKTSSNWVLGTRILLNETRSLSFFCVMTTTFAVFGVVRYAREENKIGQKSLTGESLSSSNIQCFVEVACENSNSDFWEL